MYNKKKSTTAYAAKRAGKPQNQVCSPVLLWCENYFSLLINVGSNTMSLEAHLAHYLYIAIYCNIINL